MHGEHWRVCIPHPAPVHLHRRERGVYGDLWDEKQDAGVLSAAEQSGHRFSCSQQSIDFHRGSYICPDFNSSYDSNYKPHMTTIDRGREVRFIS